MKKERALEILTEEIQDYLPEDKWGDYEAAVETIIDELQRNYEIQKNGVFLVKNKDGEYYAESGIRELWKLIYLHLFVEGTISKLGLSDIVEKIKSKIDMD